VDRTQFWAMVEAARTASRERVYRQLELAAAQLGDLPPPEVVGYRRMELLAARLGELPLSEIVGDQPMEGRLGDLPLLTEVVSLRQIELLAARLGDLPLSEVLGFHRVVEELEAESFRVDLWAAALVIHRMGPGRRQRTAPSPDPTAPPGADSTTAPAPPSTGAAQAAPTTRSHAGRSAR
jgi:Protein of unknown function (DUF4240)